MLAQGDIRDGALGSLDADSIDSCVTDPPYEINFMAKTWDKSGVAFSPDTWAEVYRVLKPGAYLLAFGGTRTFHRMTVAVEDAGFEIRDCLCWLYGSGFPKSRNVSKDLDDEGAAKQWDGWGTALKPAWEPIILARKPLAAKTVASNVLQYGTGAINVDGCRIPIEDGAKMARNNKPGDNGWKNSSGGPNRAAIEGEPPGRWPANLVLDEEAGAMLDEQSGDRPSGGGIKTPVGSRPYGSATTWNVSKTEGKGEAGIGGDTGGASRFFYSAKVSQAERNAGLADKNPHPTVKPISLMRWLVRLVTQPGGIVLDPFMGSGTTGIAAALEQMHFEGRDLDPANVEIARQRIAHWTKILQPELL